MHGNPRLTVVDRGITTWSPDSTLLAVAESIGLLLWRVSDGALVSFQRYPRGPLETRRVSWSPDGRWIVIAGLRRAAYEGVTVIVDREKATLREIDQRTEVALDDQLQFAPDGKTVRAGAIELELATGRTRRVPYGMPARGVNVRVKQMDQTTALELVEPTTGKVLRTLPYRSALLSTRVLDGGTRVAVGTEGELQILALPSGDLISRVPLPGAEMITISPDGKHVAGWTIRRAVAAGDSKRQPQPQSRHEPFLAMWDVATGAQLWRDPTRCCAQFAFSPDGELLQQGLGSLSEELIATRTGVAIRFPGALSQLAPDSRHVLVRDRGLAIWAVELNGASVDAHKLVAPAPHGLVLARSGHFAWHSSPYVEATDRGPVLRHGERCTRLARKLDDGDRFAIDVGGTTLFGIGRFNDDIQDYAKRVLQWDVESGFQLPGVVAREASEVAVLTEYRRVAFLSRGLRIFDLFRARELASIEVPGHISGPVATTDDGRFLVSTTEYGDSAAGHDALVVTIWDLEEARRVVDLRVRGRPSAIAIERRNRFVAAGMGDGQLYLWRRPDHAHVPLEVQHSGSVRNVTFSADGRWLATGADDGVVNVFDADTGKRQGSVELVADRPQLLTWSASGTTLTIDTARGLVVSVAVDRALLRR